jgi:hypothetical protein
MASGGRFSGTAGIGWRDARVGAVGCYSCVRQVEDAVSPERFRAPTCHVMDGIDMAKVEEWLGLAGSSRQA